MKDDEIRKAVRGAYARIATGERPAEPAGTLEADSCCAPQETAEPTGCGCSTADTASMAVGYSTEQLGAIPDGANLGLGCGNPTALASLKKGEVVLDLGSGGGIDCFLAASAVGRSGKVIGVDMTPQMIEKARGNLEKGDYGNVEFRLGEIEHLPVADSSVNVMISNCVINLSPDKPQVFKEAYRTLKPGGRIMVSDIVLLKELPESVRNSAAAYAACVGGASMKEEYLAAIAAAGFEDVEVVSETFLAITGELAGTIVSINVHALKPG